ncbi:MAG: hypothetical protein IKZ88_06050 [Neisseriaceae bacterium]|nr:hypothetical protein [Neisseriaceae bacterium]
MLLCKWTAMPSFLLDILSGCLKPSSSLRAVPKARRGNLLKQFLNEHTRV